LFGYADGAHRCRVSSFGHAARVIGDFSDNSVDLVINSPPYWTAVEYDGGRSWWAYYDAYLDDIQAVRNEWARVLRPNRKLCINTPTCRFRKR